MKILSTKTKLVFAVFLTAFAMLSCESETKTKKNTVLPEYENPTGKEFPIMAWYSIKPDSALTRERYQELREAGFNISFSHFENSKTWDKALEACDGTGVKLMLTSYDLFSDTENLVGKYKDNPNVCGWFLRDEPITSGFPELAEFRDRVYSADSSHLVYLNLLPSLVPAESLQAKSYEDYVQRFLDEVRLSFVSYDFYPIISDSGRIVVRPNFYENLEKVSKVSADNGVPFWAFCLSTAHDPYPIPNNVHMRLEAFASLAYGAQGIQYFTYWQPGTDTWNFHNAPIDETGKRTNVYYLVKDLNKEIQSLSKVFLGAEALDVSHTGDNIPLGTKRLTTLPTPFTELSYDGEGLLVSHLRNGSNEYLMLVNRDINHSQSVKLKRDRLVGRVRPDGTITKDKPESFVLAPGGYAIFTCK